jgi:hypothetical protein
VHRCTLRIRSTALVLRPRRYADNALENGHVAAAERLLERGATLMLGAALCLGRWTEAERLQQSYRAISAFLAARTVGAT